MTYQCPACQRSFDEPGFCPFDGKQLAPHGAADQATVSSAEHRAQSEAETTDHLPTEPADATDSRPNKVRAVSASAGHSEAMEMFEGAVSEYDRLVGETLDGRYYIQRKLGEGGMGVVFAAKHAVIERPLAIKVLKREVMRDTATIKRFVQEAKAASRIGHPNIVDVTDFGTTPEGMTYSVMEFVDGTTLAKAIKHGAPFAPERAVRIASQIARALGAAHDKGIVHRDLKPENVFLIDRDERPDFVKIVDFGIAKVQPVDGVQEGPRLTRAGSVFGTPEYMSPEQASGKGDTDRRVDIYALGTILYEMIVGHVPHRGGSMIRTIAMQMLDPVVPPSQAVPGLAVPPALEAVILKALAKRREDRYQTMSELLAALDRVAGELEAPMAGASLAPLPPGADPGITPSLPPAALSAAPPRRSKPETKQLHEPQFVAGGARSLQVFDDPEPEPKKRWPVVAGLLLLLGGGAVAVAVMTMHHDRPADHGHEASAPGDAAVLAQATDAAELAPADAAVVIAIAPDAGVRVTHPGRDAGVASLPGDHPATVTIEVLTRPAEANVFQGKTYRGPSGVRLTEKWGTKLNLECRAPGFKGKIRVMFDGSLTAVMCTATRVKLCVEGLKNPLDNCEEAPQGPVTRPTP